MHGTPVETELVPNYKNLLDVAYNKEPERVPLYEHSDEIRKCRGERGLV